VEETTERARRHVVERRQYIVPGMHCGHCETAVRDEVSAVPGVESVEVDLATKLVEVAGEPLDDAAIRAAIEEAGYEAP
jgi:copper chaperone